jgi:hypothetical protein
MPAPMTSTSGIIHGPSLSITEFEGLITFQDEELKIRLSMKRDST